MNSEFVLNDNAYDFFKQLSATEKLLFLYDLLSNILEDDESDNSFFDFPSDINEPTDLQTISLNSIIKQHGKSLSNLIRSSILTETYTNVIIINNYMVLNSQLSEAMDNTIQGLSESGMILKSVNLSESAYNTVKHQNFCKVYQIIGQGNQMNYN